jgi:hypothetical protein
MQSSRTNLVLGAAGSRRGSIYLLALGVSTLVTVIGLTALMTIRANQRVARQTGARAAAQSLALSAVEHAITVLNDTPQWRTMLTHDVEAAKVALGQQGTFAWKLIDEFDGDLSNDASQPVRLQGIGRSGQAVQMYGVELQPVKTPLSCLTACVHGNGTITFNGATVQADQPVSTNSSMNASNTKINAPAQAAGQITGVTYNGTKEPGVAPREMPDPTTVFDYYFNNGTEIPLGSLLLDASGFRVLERVALGAAHNPLGSPNAEGIYVVRCGGSPVIVRDCRIAGTLVLLEPGVSSRIEGSVNWEPAVATYPALMVRGSMDVRMTTNPLSESSGGSNVNFNPPGMPYNGSEDLDTSDQYPSIIRGLVYVSEKLINNTNGIYVDGMIVVGQTTNIGGPMNVRYRRDIYQDAPPGFYRMNRIVMTPRTWQQDVR